MQAVAQTPITIPLYLAQIAIYIMTLHYQNLEVLICI